MKYLALTVMTAGLTLGACSQAETAVSNAAEKTAEAAKAIVPDTSISDIPSGKYVMDKTHGYVTFSYWHQGFSKPVLRFDDVDAVLTLDNENPVNSSVDVTINADSINTAIPKFDTHIKNEDMFDVANYPTITFKSTKLTQTTPATGTLTGDLTMKGVTKPITLDVRFNKAGNHFRTKKPMAGFSATGKLMRSDWNMGYAVPNVGDAVNLVIEAEFNAAE